MEIKSTHYKIGLRRGKLAYQNKIGPLHIFDIEFNDYLKGVDNHHERLQLMEGWAEGYESIQSKGKK